MKKIKIPNGWGMLKRGIHEVNEQQYNYYISIGVGVALTELEEKEGCSECEEHAKTKQVSKKKSTKK